MRFYKPLFEIYLKAVAQAMEQFCGKYHIPWNGVLDEQQDRIERDPAKRQQQETKRALLIASAIK